MFCKSCGAELPTGASVCEKCGKAVQTIMIAEEPKEQSVATSAPKAEPSAPAKKKKKPDGLILPLVMLIVSGGSLAYLYIGNTFHSIMSWFTSLGEEKHLREDIIVATDPMEYTVNIAIVVGAVILALIGVIGVVILFKRLGRKVLSKKDD